MPSLTARLFCRAKPGAAPRLFGPADAPAPLYLPILATRVPAGFPSPASDYIEDSLDLHKFLIPHPSATFFFRVQGDSLRDAGICDGDILVVDRSVEAVSGAIVLATLDGAFTVKVLVITRDGIRLEARNPAYKPIEISDPDALHIWGPVTGVVRKIGGSRVRSG